MYVPVVICLRNAHDVQLWQSSPYHLSGMLTRVQHFLFFGTGRLNISSPHGNSADADQTAYFSSSLVIDTLFQYLGSFYCNHCDTWLLHNHHTYKM